MMKHTQTKKLPENWQLLAVKELASVSTGEKDTQNKVEGGDYPFFVRSQTVERINSYSFDGPAVLTAGDGHIGKIFHFVEGKFDFHQRVYKISDFSEKIIPKYFFYYFKGNFLKQAMKYTAKTSVDSVRMEMITHMRIAVPPLAEQERIVEILSDSDAAIATMEKVSEKQQEKHKAISSFLFANKEICNSMELSEICKISTGKKDVKEGNPNGAYPFFTCSKENTYSDSYSFDAEAILIAGNANIGNPRYFKGKFEAYQRTYVLTEFKRIQPVFLCEFLAIALSKKIAKEKQDSVMSYIKLKTLSSMKIPLVSTEHQEKCAKIFNLLAEEKTKTENQISALKKQRRGLMQQLLTGKLRPSPKKGKGK